MSFALLSAHIAGEVQRAIRWSALDSKAQICLVLDPSLSPAINRLLDPLAMQSLGVADIFELAGVRYGFRYADHQLNDAAQVEPLITDCRHVLYIVRPEEEMIGRLAFQALRLESVKAIASSDAKAAVFVACVPRLTSVCAAQLERFGLYGRLHIESLPALAINCLDDDLATFDDSITFQRAFLENDPHVVDCIARNLLEIQRIYGPFCEVSGRGRISTAVCNAVCGHVPAPGAAAIEPISQQGQQQRISRVICIDRTVDLITPMLTAFTYEGVIDEIVGIEMGYCKIARDIVVKGKPRTESLPAGAGDPTDMVSCPLFNTDPNYARIRDKSFPFVLTHMSTLIKQVSSKLNERNDVREIAQLKGFVKSLPNYLSELDSVSTHTNLLMHLTTVTNSPAFLQLLRAEDSLLNRSDLDQVFDTIEYSIVKHDQWQKPVRLLCLWAQLLGGLNDDDYSSSCRKLINSYGAALMLPVISRLARSGLFYRKGDLPSNMNWKNLKRDLNLVADASKPTDPESPVDYHFVHGYCAYAPILVRILEKRIKDKSWTSINNITNKDESCFNKKLLADAPGATLVVIIGGMTRTEVAALRFLNSRRPESPFLICGSLATGTTILQSLRMLSTIQ